MKTITVPRNVAVKMLLDKSKSGRLFSTVFIKKNGEIRSMVAKRGVKKHLKGGDLKYSPIEYNLLSVFDMQVGGYRMVNLKTMSQFKINGIVYKVAKTY